MRVFVFLIHARVKDSSDMPYLGFLMKHVLDSQIYVLFIIVKNANK